MLRIGKAVLGCCPPEPLAPEAKTDQKISARNGSRAGIGVGSNARMMAILPWNLNITRPVWMRTGARRCGCVRALACVGPSVSRSASVLPLAVIG